MWPFIGGKMVRQKFSLLLIIIAQLSICSSATRVKDLGPALPEFIEKHANKNWLIKFYAPWCHQCQLIETIYNNVAEKIYHRYDNLIVGQVDCTESVDICEMFGIKRYPTIMFLNNGTRISYKGPRREAAIVDFAERLNGPEIGTIDDCSHLKSAASRRGLIVVSTERDLNGDAYKEFKSLASSLKANWWFFHFSKSCKNLVGENGLYILKRHLNRAIKFQPELEEKNLKQAINKWINKESFPVYGEFNWQNYEKNIAYGKMMIIAILDEYTPARKYTEFSKKLDRSFEELAKKTSQLDENLLFLYTSDLDLVEYITLRSIHVPNVMILRSDYSYQLIVGKDISDGNNNDIIYDKLNERSIKMHIAAAKLDDTAFEGGNSPFHILFRCVYHQANRLYKMYLADPLLVGILILFPSAVFLFMIYLNCIYDDGSMTDEAIQAELERMTEEELEQLRRESREYREHAKRD